MHQITTTITVGDRTEVEVAKFAFDSQEEVLDFLNDYEHMELDRLYDELRKVGGRTFAAIEPCHRKALRRHVKGKAYVDGCKPVEGSITIAVSRVA